MRSFHVLCSGMLLTTRLTGSGPQRQATGPFVCSKVEDTVQRRTVTQPLLWSSWPGAAKRSTGDGELDRDGKSAPPASRPAGARGAPRCNGCPESP